MAHASERAIPKLTPLRAVWLAAALVLLALNFYIFTLTDWTMLRGGSGADWQSFVEAGHRVFGTDLYRVQADYAFRYSPLLAYCFAPLSIAGPWVWRALHVAAALALPGRWLKLAVLISWPFWFDVEAGNLVIFALLLAAWALRGNRWATGGFLVMALLVPRPLMLPVLAWILWRRPEWRLPFIGLFAVDALAVALTGWGPAWLGSLAASSDEVHSILNFGPSRLLGIWWAPIGLGLAAALTWRGRLGLASLAASPYWLPYYFVLLFLEWPRHQRAVAEERP